jgi:hypothetical protein
MDHPECRILKSDAVVNIEIRPEANSFDLFLKKSPVILRGLIATQAMVLNSPKYRASFQSDGVLGTCRLPRWQRKGTQNLGDITSSRYAERAENRRIGWAILERKVSHPVDNQIYNW